MASLIRDEKFALYWFSELLAYFSISANTIILLAAVDDTLPANLAEGLLLTTSFLPALVITPFAARLIVRFGARAVLLATKFASAAMALGLMAALLGQSVWVVLLLNALFSSSTIIFIVASGVLVTLIVDKKDLVAANTLTNLTPSAMIVANGLLIGHLEKQPILRFMRV
ncbi:MAG: MFS transporter [Hyphomicrobium sp.]|nr:MFS transporter [Hyphomicrobium sp.]